MLPVNGLYGHIARNLTKSALMMAGFFVLVAIYWWAGCLMLAAVLGLSGAARDRVGFDGSFTAILNWASDLALAHWLIPVMLTAAWFVFAYLCHRALIRAATGAKPVERRDEPKLYNLVENLAITAGLPMPRIEIIESDALNAYAAGLSPSSASIGVTRGLLAKLKPDELEAVLAHELTHIKNGDVRLMMVALIFTGGISLLGDFVGSFFSSGDGWYWAPRMLDVASAGGREKDSEDGPNSAVVPAILACVLAFVLMGVAQVFAQLNQLALSRSREYLADAGSVELTKNPDALISALQAISENDDVPLASENMRAMMISRSLDGDSYFDALLSTHPAVADRIDKLTRFAGGRDTMGTAVAARTQRGALANPAPAAGPAPAMPFLGARASFGRRG